MNILPDGKIERTAIALFVLAATHYGAYKWGETSGVSQALDMIDQELGRHLSESRSKPPSANDSVGKGPV